MLMTLRGWSHVTAPTAQYSSHSNLQTNAPLVRHPVIPATQNPPLRHPTGPTTLSPVLAPLWMRVVLGDCCHSSGLRISKHGLCLHLKFSYPNPPLPGTYSLCCRPREGLTVSFTMWNVQSVTFCPCNFFLIFTMGDKENRKTIDSNGVK